MRRNPRRAEVDPQHPAGWATSDRNGHIGNLKNMKWQHEWRGSSVVNTRVLVHEDELDIPQRQLGTLVIPPDPPPLFNARPENYDIDEQPVSTRYTIGPDGFAKDIRVILNYEPWLSNRILLGQGANIPVGPTATPGVPGLYSGVISTTGGSTGAVHAVMPAGSGAFAVTGNAATLSKVANACIASGGTPVGVMDGLTPTGAWSASRKLFTAYAGLNYSSAAGFTFFDQSGNARNFVTGSTAGTSPTVPCTERVAGVLFSPGNWLDNTALSNFITTGAGYMIVTIRPTAFNTDNPATPYNNSTVIGDNTQNASIVTSNNSGSPLAYITTWDGSAKSVSTSIAANTVYVLEWRHEGGVLYQRKNGAGETSTAAGNTTMGGNLNMGGRSLAPAPFDGQIFEAAVFSTVPNLATRDALVQSFGLYAGAAV